MDVMVATIDDGRRTRTRRTTPTRYSYTVSSRAVCSGSSTIGDNDIGGGIAMISDADVCRPSAVHLAYFGNGWRLEVGLRDFGLGCMEGAGRLRSGGLLLRSYFLTRE